MANPFGRKLREARRGASLTQSDLGGEEMSASYVSLVESGRREPSDEMKSYFAEKLGIDVSVVDSWGNADIDSGAEGAIGVAAARTALAGGQFAEAEALAKEAAGRSLEVGNLPLYWELSSIRAQSARMRDDYQVLLNIARDLLDQEFVQHAPRLRCWALAQQSVGLRETGNVEGAVAAAATALAMAREVAHTQESGLGRVHLSLYFMIYAAAVAEAGRKQDIEDLAAELEEELGHGDPSEKEINAELHWVVGNLHFALAAPETGTRHHDAALDIQKDAQVGLEIRLRLLRATVSHRLEAGYLGGRTGELVATLVHIAQWVEGPEHAYVAEFMLGKWLVLSGEKEAAHQVLRTLLESVDHFPPCRKAKALELVALYAATDQEERSVLLVEAAQIFTELEDPDSTRRVLDALAVRGD